MTTYNLGDQPALTVLFETLAGVAANPTTTVCTVIRPDGSETVITGPTNPVVGTFVWTLPVLDQPGPWTWIAEGTAGLITSEEGSFHVRTSRRR